jgi:hypothetical protein
VSSGMLALEKSRWALTGDACRAIGTCNRLQVSFAFLRHPLQTSLIQNITFLDIVFFGARPSLMCDISHLGSSTRPLVDDSASNKHGLPATPHLKHHSSRTSPSPTSPFTEGDINQLELATRLHGSGKILVSPSHGLSSSMSITHISAVQLVVV